MSQLKMMALDKEDLEVLSSHVQDALLYVKDIDFDLHRGQVNLVLNRCCYEKDLGGNKVERSHAGLVFSHVKNLQAQNIDRSNKELLLNLLTIDFLETDAPAGELILNFSDDAYLRLSVDCLEVHLADVGERWVSHKKPQHG